MFKDITADPQENSWLVPQLCLGSCKCSCGCIVHRKLVWLNDLMCAEPSMRLFHKHKNEW